MLFIVQFDIRKINNVTFLQGQGDICLEKCIVCVMLKWNTSYMILKKKQNITKTNYKTNQYGLISNLSNISVLSL